MLESKPESRSALEVESIELFISFFKLIGLQKSVGEIYGLLFVSPRALAMDEIMTHLGISLGAASQGLKVLRSVGAVKSVDMPDDRRDHYLADLELNKFAYSFIQEELKPRLELAMERIEKMQLIAQELDITERSTAEQRLERLTHWLKRSDSMLPSLLKILVN